MRQHRGAFRAVAAIGVAAATLTATAFMAAPAMATSASNSWNLSGGDKWEVNAFHCTSYAQACDWTSSVKLLGTNPSVASSITNRSELEAHGVSVSIEISATPKATVTMVSKSLGQAKWTNTNAYIADLSGQMKPSLSTLYVSTRSCGSGKVNSSITVSEKCVYAGVA